MASHEEDVSPSPLIRLDSGDGDAAPFIDVASRLITATARHYNVPRVYAIHIDGWFGKRWLGFIGNYYGKGIHSHTLRRSLKLPPFHPTRVLDCAVHHLRDDGVYVEGEQVPSLHFDRNLFLNKFRQIRRDTLHAWYSGNSDTARKGAVMVYLSNADVTKGWYTLFDGDAEWRLDQHIGITRTEVDELLESAGKSGKT